MLTAIGWTANIHLGSFNYHSARTEHVGIRKVFYVLTLLRYKQRTLCLTNIYFTLKKIHKLLI